MQDRTSFVIAQRISTVLNADKILVLDDGQIAAEGTHRELLATSPIYRDIYESQLGNGVRSMSQQQRRTRKPSPLPQPADGLRARAAARWACSREAEKSKNTRGTLLRLWGYIQRQRWVLIGVADAGGADLLRRACWART